ncbi:MAG: hypothetical protein ACT4P3_01550 [Betaproteobacteria bacterium]
MKVAKQKSRDLARLAALVRQMKVGPGSSRRRTPPSRWKSDRKTR